MTAGERRLSTFRLDEAKIFESEVLCIALDGRVPDEGACELGIAYRQKKPQEPGKLLVGLQTDGRAAFSGSRLNPMLRVPLEPVAESEETLLKFLRSRCEPGWTSG